VNAPPLSLYVHLPWCVRKCPYCDFNSHRAGDVPPRARYVGSLLADLDRERVHAAGRELETIFLGGGTPSLFTPDEIERLIAGIRKRFACTDDIEITMEANPGTVDCGAPAGYRHAGVNRLSIGAQSFSDDMLLRLGRIHTSADTGNTFEAAREAGFDNINLDLMHGLPGQDLDGALADLRAAIELEPEHISWYQLTLEPNTVFHARPPRDLPDEDLVESIQSAGASLLEQSGYSQYEVSAWSRPGRACRHNLNYWNFGDYIAIGAGAHGKVTDVGGVSRYVKPANPREYMARIEDPGFAAAGQRVEGDDLVFEFMLNALRLRAGFTESRFAERTGLEPGVLAARLQGVTERGLVRRTGDNRWVPTALGRRFLDDLQAEFLPPSH